VCRCYPGPIIRRQPHAGAAWHSRPLRETEADRPIGSDGGHHRLRASRRLAFNWRRAARTSLAGAGFSPLAPGRSPAARRGSRGSSFIGRHSVSLQSPLNRRSDWRQREDAPLRDVDELLPRGISQHFAPFVERSGGYKTRYALAHARYGRAHMITRFLKAALLFG
jgi:hypothetical protein